MVYEYGLPQIKKMLSNLSSFIDKGAAFADSKKIEAEVLWNSRLAPDQFPFVRQVQIACDSAKLGTSRLTGKEAPSHADTEKTTADLKKRIAETVAYLDTMKADDFKALEKKNITTPRWNGEYLFGDEYFHQHVLANVYFHTVTAYSILRHNGVELGKKDFLGQMPFKK